MNQPWTVESARLEQARTALLGRQCTKLENRYQSALDAHIRGDHLVIRAPGHDDLPAVCIDPDDGLVEFRVLIEGELDHTWKLDRPDPHGEIIYPILDHVYRRALEGQGSG